MKVICIRTDFRLFENVQGLNWMGAKFHHKINYFTFPQQKKKNEWASSTHEKRAKYREKSLEIPLKMSINSISANSYKIFKPS